MSTGIVKFFNETKGYGFVKVNETNQEVFVHVSELKDQIRQDDEVTFEIQEGKRGLNAVNVKLA
jgi:CspA family cold shock protein